jgi:hypothetical protein
MYYLTGTSNQLYTTIEAPTQLAARKIFDAQFHNAKYISYTEVR